MTTAIAHSCPTQSGMLFCTISYPYGRAVLYLWPILTWHSIHTNGDNSDGYLDYGAEHRDFNEDGCTKDKWATISGDGNETKCTFPC